MRCDRCGTESPDGFRFCGACGARLPGEETLVPEQERKMVTALFCDLVGFTPRAERMDPEDVHGLLRAYYVGVRGEFERFGGTVAKFIGDAVFVLFGAPRAHEDDPERAVRAALAGLDAVADINAAHPGLDLQVHIGVTTGEALVTFGPDPDAHGGLAWGDILNTASRLEGAAAPDTILVDDATYMATRHAIEYRPAAPVNAKGIAEPVAVWRPIAPLARRGFALTDAGQPPLVGRREELAVLRAALDEARAGRGPRLVTVIGEPGIGKSRLVLELFRHTEAGADPVAWRVARSPPYPDGVTFWALGEIVKRQADILATDGAVTAAGKLAAAVADLVPDPAQAARIESHLRSLVGLEGDGRAHGDDRRAAFAAWRHFLEALARRKPLVLGFEDIHCADDGVLDFIEHVVEWSQDVALLIVATARPELLDRRPAWGPHERATTLSLARLAPGDSRELVSTLAGPSTLTDDTMNGIVARASGNPLYSVEFMRMLADRGLLGPPEPRSRAGAIEALPVPDSLRGTIASRLDSLSAEDKGLLQAGAVIGRAMWPGALAAITGRDSRWVLERLTGLEARQFLTRASRSSVEHEPEFRFQHALIRDVAYSQIPRSRRGEIHRRTAEWLTSLSPDRTVDRAELLAHHYQSAYELAMAAGGAADGLADDARLALRDAGDRAVALHAFPAAARLFRAALALWPADDPQRPWLLLRLGRSLYKADIAGTDVLAQARDALVAAGDSGAAAEAEALLAMIAQHQGRRDRVSEHLDRAVALVAGVGPTRSKAEVLVDLANHLVVARDDERAIAAATEALEIARALGLREIEASALSMIGISRALSGDLGGREDLRRSIAITEEIGSHLSAHSYAVLADLEGQLGDLTTCFALHAEARRHAQHFGHAGFVRWLAAEGVGEGYWTGAWDEALAVADTFIAEAERGAPSFMEGYCRAMRGRIRLARDDGHGALADGARALDFARTAADLQMLYPAIAFLSCAEVAVGSRDRGGVLADELLALWRANLDAYPASAWAVDLAYALDALGRGAELLEIARAAGTQTLWLQAVVAYVAGDFVAAADRFGRIGSRPDAACAQLQAAVALAGAGQEAQARAALDAAVGFYAGVGATMRLREAELVARAIGVTPPGAAAARPGAG